MVDPQAGESVAEALARYRARPDVLYAEPNRFVPPARRSAPRATPATARSGRSTRSRPSAAGRSSPARSRRPRRCRSGSSTPGVDATHPDLGNVSGLSATCLSGACSQGVPTDDNGHGTHVSGIAGRDDRQRNRHRRPLLRLAADRRARVFSADASQGADDSDIANGIAWAASHGAKVINLSLGATGPTYPFTLCNAVELAINSYGAAVVAAAGNGNPPGTPVATPSYPAACPGAIGVAATDESDLPASFSNYGSPDVFVSAPGVDVLSTWPGNSYALRRRNIDGVPVRDRARRPDPHHASRRPRSPRCARSSRSAPTRSARARTAPTRTAPAPAAPGSRTTATAGSTSRKRSRRRSRRRPRLRRRRHRRRSLRRLPRRRRRRRTTRRRPSCTSTRRAAATGSALRLRYRVQDDSGQDLRAGASSTGRRSC